MVELMIGEMEYVWYILLACLIAGSIAAVMVLYTATDGSHTAWRMVRCFGGFTCSMVWIAAIADEVVSVLQVSDISGEDEIMGCC
jgi:sodium/potassium/calcium exchanger 6